MTWFVNLVVSLFTTLLQGFSSLLLMAGLTIKNVIVDNMMSNGSVPFGSGSWFDVLPSGRNETVMHTFMGLFWVLGSAALLVAFYATVARIAGAHSSSVQRERVRTGLIEVAVAVLLIFAGERLAVSITQLFYDLSIGVMTLGQTSIPTFTLPSTSGNQIVTFFNAVVEFVQVVMAVVLYVMYQFRELFLDAWVIFFPLAMACYAHEKTRGIAKFWWTEWIYQMAVPFGQALVFSFSYAMVNPHNQTELGIADIFTALTGVVGFVASSVYVRKIVSIVAQSFEAPVLGRTAGGMAAVAAGVLAGDAVAGAGIGVLGKAYGAVGKGAFQAVDKRFAPLAKGAIERAPETHAGMIREGATLDDVMSHHMMAASGSDPLQQAGGAGLEGALKGARGMGQPVGRATPSAGNSGSSRQRVGSMGPLQAGFSSRTLGAVNHLSSGMSETVKGSHMAKWAQTKWQGMQNDGGLIRRGLDHVAPTVGQLVQSKPGLAMLTGAASVAGGVAMVGVTAGAMMATGDGKGSVQKGRGAFQRAATAVEGVASAPQAYQTNRVERMQRMEDARGHIRQLLHDNVAMQRMGNINPYPYRAADDQLPEGTFAGNTPAMDAYLTAETGLSKALQEDYRQTAGSGTSQSAYESVNQEIGRYRGYWDQEQHIPDLHRLSPKVQEAYRSAYTAYRPYRQDVAARARVEAGRVNLTEPHEETRKQDMARSQAFLADARASILATK